MLGRTANGLFWMFRYLERAENAARLLDAGLR
ncbi:MAG: alpha-E domain-containing protein, partial [Erythrobacter sp.]|nr:alpha-E domain-containing protein [Erythrobacter sp.]